MSDAEYRVNRIARDALFLRYKKLAEDRFLAAPPDALKAECEAARATGGEVAYDAALARAVQREEELERLAGKLAATYPWTKAGDSFHTAMLARFAKAHEQGGHDGLRQAYLDVIAEGEARNAEHAKEQPFLDRISEANGDIVALMKLAFTEANAASAAKSREGGSQAEQSAAYNTAYLAALPASVAIAEAGKAREVEAEKLRLEGNKLATRLGVLGGDLEACRVAAMDAGALALDPVIEAERTAMLRAAGVEDIPAAVVTAPHDIFEEVLRRACVPPGIDADAFEETADEAQRRYRDRKVEDIRNEQSERLRGARHVAYYGAAVAVARSHVKALEAERNAETARFVASSFAAGPLGLLLGYLCYVFAAASLIDSLPPWYDWIALIGSGLGLAALTRKSAPSVVWLGLGLPVCAIGFAFFALALKMPPPLLFVVSFVAVWWLIIHPDKWARVVAGLLWKNATQHKGLPIVFTRLDNNNLRRTRIRALGIAFWWSLTAVVVASAATIGFEKSGQLLGYLLAFFAFLLMLAIGTGANMWKDGKADAGVGFFGQLNRTTWRDIKSEGKARMEWVYRNGAWTYEAMGTNDDKPSVVYADVPSSGEPARPGYVKKFDHATGRYEWAQIIVGNPNIIPKVEPLRPRGEMGSGGFVGEED